MNVDDFDIDAFVKLMVRVGYAEDITWAENLGPPSDPDYFGSEIVFVICNSGMKNTIARQIYERVMMHIRFRDPRGRERSAYQVFKHPGKARAIDHIWRHRHALLEQYLNLDAVVGHVATDADRLEWLRALPWIGDITKYHVAKNFGLQFAKPDVHLMRLAATFGMPPQELCEVLARRSGLRVATIDTLLWRGAAIGALDTATGSFLST